MGCVIRGYVCEGCMTKARGHHSPSLPGISSECYVHNTLIGTGSGLDQRGGLHGVALALFSFFIPSYHRLLYKSHQQINDMTNSKFYIFFSFIVDKGEK